MTGQRVLVAMPEGDVQAAWLEVLLGHLKEELAHAEPGQCLRVGGLPRSLLETAIGSLYAGNGTTVRMGLVDRTSGPEPWRVGVHRIVEYRNLEGPVVLAAIPPDVKLAAGDSVDISVFREIRTESLGDLVTLTLLAQLNGRVGASVELLLEDLDRRGFAFSESQQHAFLATVASQPREVWAVGASLGVLGLVPDFALFDQPGEMSFRLGQRNLPVVKALEGKSGTLLERVLRLPVTEQPFREKLFKLLTSYGGDIAPALRAIATELQWRDLSLDLWPFGDEVVPPGEIRVEVSPLRLPRRIDDGLLLWDPGTKVKVGWSTTPPPADVTGLAAFRVELVNSEREIVWESPLIRRGTGKSSHRSRTVRDLHDIEPGIHFFRVTANAESADPFPVQPLRNPEEGEGGKRTNETEDFLVLAPSDVGETSVAPTRAYFVGGHTEAELLARSAAIGSTRPVDGIVMTDASWDNSIEAATDVATATLRFDLRQYTVRLSQRLRQLETQLLATPSHGGHVYVNLDRRHGDPEVVPLVMPSEFVAARQDAFEAIGRASSLEDDGHAVCLVDLSKASDQIERYAHAYLDWLVNRDAQALLVDVIRVDLGHAGRVALVAPTHPLRLLWMLQHQAVARDWVRRLAGAALPVMDPIQLFRDSFNGFGLPPLAVLGASEGYVDAGVLPGGWGLYVPPRLRDSRTMLASLKSRLGVAAEQRAETDLQPRILADKLEAYLQQHPYTPALVLNVLNPGDGGLVVAALIDLESRMMRADRTLRYEVRLFAEDPSTEVVGEAFRDLMEPERQVAEAAARLAGPGRSFLFPKLAWSRKATARFLEDPERFPAHVTIILDAFPVMLRVARVDPDDRSSFVHGLIQEAPRRFVGRGDAFSWIRRPAPRSCTELVGAPDRAALIAGLVAEMGSTQAAVLAPGADSEAITGVSALDLSLAGQTLLYAAHLVSTWVLTVDSNLGVDYFDAASRQERPGYLLDFTPEFVATGGRQVLLTTRAADEVTRLVAPLTEQLDVDPDGPGPLLLLEALRSLSGRLAMRLMSAPSQVQGALGMALSRIFLEAHGLLEDAIIIPLDAHPELAVPTEEGAAALRGDLLVVSVDATERLIDFMVIESKCHRGTGLGDDLRNRIAQQVTASAERLRALFWPLETEDRVDRALRSWQLTTVLGFYLDRARRYGLVRPTAAAAFHRFIADLDRGYRMSIRRAGLVFRLDEQSSWLDESDPEIPIWVIGKGSITNMLTEAIRDFVVAAEEPTSETASESAGASRLITSTRDREPTWEDVRHTFGGPGLATRSRDDRAGSGGDDVAAGADPSGEPTGDLNEGAEVTRAKESATGDALHPSTVKSHSEIEGGDLDATDGPSWDVLLGESRSTPQYGLLASVASEPWRSVALDLNGCNTISVFGVQGGGKSYTLGSIIEMACQEIPAISRIPRPLGAVVFHYHQTQDYPPEFVSMVAPNKHAEEVEALRKMGAEPAALDDVLLLTTPDTLSRRREQFPNIQVEPIAFSSAELTVADWRFLMAATGSDALYLRLVNEVMRLQRDDLNLARIRDGLSHAGLNDGQLRLATTRLDFAARFIDDRRSLRSLMRPGRLVVVDLRDEFVERDEALGLFVTMLNVFSGAGIDKDPFNKLIVFDEAHKYMGGSLIGQVVEVIREMRHKGVSIVVASQDPVNVPSSVIELSSAVVLHRFNSPNWLKHIQRSLTSLGELTPGAMNALQPGEAFVWSNRSTDPVFTRRAVKVRMRPRVTNHGGATRTAVDDA